MKRAIIVFVMMVSMLFCVNAFADAKTSKTVSYRLEKGSSLNSVQNGLKGKQLKKRENIKKLKASSNVKSEMEGIVIEQLPNAMFRVELQNGSTITAFLAGKLRMNFIRIHFGDRVLVEIQSDQPDRGRIIWRFKG